MRRFFQGFIDWCTEMAPYRAGKFGAFVTAGLLPVLALSIAIGRLWGLGTVEVPLP